MALIKEAENWKIKYRGENSFGALSLQVEKISTLKKRYEIEYKESIIGEL